MDPNNDIRTTRMRLQRHTCLQLNLATFNVTINTCFLFETVKITMHNFAICLHICAFHFLKMRLRAKLNYNLCIVALKGGHLESDQWGK